MRVTRVIALVVMAGSVSLTALEAQTLKNAAPPAEFPPSSYSGKQYVDSRGCIYIRAGIDGNTTWVPRVTRDRKQVCGYKPTAVAGATTAKPQPQNVQTITVPAATTPKPAPAPKPATTTTTAQPKPVPAPVTTTQPRTVTTTKTTTTRPTTTTTTAPRTTIVAPAPVVVPRTTTPTPQSGGCSNASAFSQQFINKQGVRCGPQKEAPVTYGQGWEQQSSLGVTTQDRIVQDHIYVNRINTRNVAVPSGYRPVWQDDRLNPNRAERTIQAAVIQNGVMVPSGFRQVEREDDRLNPNRGFRTAQGDSQTDQIWTRTVPRTLVKFDNDRATFILPEPVAESPAEAEEPGLFRISTRSAPNAGSPVKSTTPMAPVERR